MHCYRFSCMYTPTVKYIFFLLLFVFGVSSSSSQVQAVGELHREVENIYIINPDGTTHVRQQFTLTNTVSAVYATQYALEVASNRIANIRVVSGSTKISPTVSSHSNKTTISFTFPDKVIGKDQKRTFVVEYDTPDIAQKTGNTLELNIPKLANPQEFASYTVSIRVPKTYETPTVATPNEFTTSTENGQILVTFQNVGQETGIRVLFGTNQYAKLDLTYNLENTTNTRAVYPVALPADGTYQRVAYEKIDPLPTSITSDSDGNWIAQYELEPSQKKTISVVGYATISLRPQENASLLTARPGNEYTRSQPFWQTHDQKIVKISRELKTPKDIYKYVVKNLVYDYKNTSDAGRLGAVKALDAPTQVVCTEFTDLFITLARVRGIPARAVTGYAYTQNDALRPLSLVRDVLHVWPEYWDETTAHWIPVDPTWENTTGGVDYFSRLDFNHIAFATQGISSERPYPAGMYKTQESPSKDVLVQFVDKIPNISQKFESNLKIHPRALFGIGGSYVVTLTNTSLQGVYAVPYTVRVQNSAGIVELSDKVSLHPLQTMEIPLQLPRSDILSTYQTKVNVRINSQVFDHEINVQSTIQENLVFILITIVVGVCLASIAFITWRLLVPRRRR